MHHFFHFCGNWKEMNLEVARVRKHIFILLPFSFLPLILTDEMVGEVVVPPSKKLEDLIRLAELCVDLLRQNEEFYAEVR